MAHWDSGFWRRIGGISGSCALLSALAAPLPSWALWDDRLEIFAIENVTYDSNVFRISDRVDAQSVIGSSQRSDTVFTTSLGFAFDVPVSLQRFQLGYTWYDARYRHFEDLDHDGHLARAVWLWAITPQLTGDVGYQEQESLASFANIQGRSPDLVTTRLAFANAAWQVGASWRVHGALTAAEAEHSDFRSLNDLESRAAEAGLSYVTAAENRLGVAVRGERGRMPREVTLFGAPFDNEYTQSGFGVQGRWVVTGLSRFDGRLDYTRRKYDQLPERNYSGPTFNVTYTWTPTGKITVATVARRDIAPLEDVTSSFVLVTGLAIRPDWAITDKINLRGNFDYSRWEYRGDPIRGQDFEHRVRSAGVSVLYRPLRRVAITGGIAHERRTSTLATGDYDVNTASIEARIGF